MPVTVEGVVGLRRALGKLAPDIRKELDKEVRAALKPIIADAKSKVPPNAPGGLYNWDYPGYERKPKKGRKRAFPDYNSQVIRRGLTYSVAPSRVRNSGFVSLFTLFNRSAVGAIVETAGRAAGDSKSRSQSNNKDAGERFIGAMNGVGALVDYAGRGKNSTGRLLYAAYKRNQGKALDASMKAIQNAKLTLVKRIQSSKKMVA